MSRNKDIINLPKHVFFKRIHSYLYIQIDLIYEIITQMVFKLIVLQKSMYDFNGWANS